MTDSPGRPSSPASSVADSEVTTAVGGQTEYDGSTRAPSPEAKDRSYGSSTGSAAPASVTDSLNPFGPQFLQRPGAPYTETEAHQRHAAVQSAMRRLYPEDSRGAQLPTQRYNHWSPAQSFGRGGSATGTRAGSQPNPAVLPRQPALSSPSSSMAGLASGNPATEPSDDSIDAQVRAILEKEARELAVLHEYERREDERLQSFGPLRELGYDPREYTQESGRWVLTAEAAKLRRRSTEQRLQLFPPLASDHQRRAGL